MKLITTLFSSSSKSGGKSQRKAKGRSMRRSDTPSFGSSASSSSNDSFSKATGALRTPRSVILGRNASCLDVEYCSAASPAASVPQALSDLFCVFDRNGDGKITKQELEVVLRGLGKADPPTEEEVAMMLAEVDGDGDGCISLEDFEALVAALRTGPGESDDAAAEEEELRDAFGVFDADGDGRISAEELLEVFRALGDDGCTVEDCRRMIGGVDSRGGGFVFFDDFVRMMAGLRCR